MKNTLLLLVVVTALLALPASAGAQDLTDLNRQYMAQRKANQWREAEKIGLRMLEVARQRRDGEWIAVTLWNLGTGYEAEKKLADAETYFKQALAAYQELRGARHADSIECLVRLAKLAEGQGRLGQSEPYRKQLLAISEQIHGEGHANTLPAVINLAIVYWGQGKLAAAEPQFRRILAIRERELGPNDLLVAASANDLAVMCENQGKYAEAEPLYRRALAIREDKLGDSLEVAATLNNMGLLHNNMGQFDEGVRALRRSLGIREKKLRDDHFLIAQSLGNLGLLYDTQGKYTDAEPLYRKALTIREKTLPADHPDLAESCNNLGALYHVQGKYAEAEPLYRRALAIRAKVLPEDHPDLAMSCSNLGVLYAHQDRDAEAEPLFRRALAAREKLLGPNNIDVAASLNNLALLHEERRQFAQAEPLFLRALAIKEKVRGPDHADVALSLHNLAAMYQAQKKFVEAERFLIWALSIHEKSLGADHPDVAASLYNLATLNRDRGKAAEAEKLVARALAILEKKAGFAERRFLALNLRAQLKWQAGQRDPALADLAGALGLAEQVRTQGTGAEQDRARFFARFTGAFERMVDWQMQQGDVGAALAAMERSRSRTLLEQAELRGLDLLAGLPEDQARPLRQREADARVRVTTLEQRLRLLESRRDLPENDARRQQSALQAELTEARQKHVEAYGAVRTASPLYRLTVGKDRTPIGLPALQEWLGKENGLLLEYLVGEDAAYVLVVPPGGAKARIEKLQVDKDQAKALGIEPGPLTAQRLEAALANEKATGVLQHLRDPERASKAAAALAALWPVLVPEAERTALAAGQVQRLLVAPDGALALLPFEVLVLKNGPNPQYLLDAGIPIVYGPSATMLTNLAGQSLAEPRREAVLTVGAPAYAPLARSDRVLDQLTPRSRYGQLQALPHTGVESGWVADNYRKTDQAVIVLRGQEATEANVRAQVSGRRVVHLACHGLADQAHGNFFGSLALTPGRAADDPGDDGFLTLGEIYALDLRACELAILSACDTNYGPHQKGEGVWALSRGFVVAGARRVMASNWLVDDEAAASLVSLFTESLAKAAARGERPDHARALLEAKRWARKQEKYQSPYYWGSFVLVGPN